MKLKRVTVRWEKAVEVDVFVPESMSDAQVLTVAQDTNVDTWDDEGWEAWISATHRVELLEEHRRMAPRPNRLHDVVPGSALDVPGALILSDDRDEFVHPTDASWWLNEGEKP